MKAIVWFIQTGNEEIIEKLKNGYADYADFITGDKILKKVNVENTGNLDDIRNNSDKIIFVSNREIDNLPNPNVILSGENVEDNVNAVKNKMIEEDFIDEDQAYSSEEESDIEKHLEDLGYI